MKQKWCSPQPMAMDGSDALIVGDAVMNEKGALKRYIIILQRDYW